MPFFPVDDENPIAITPYLTYGFIIFNIICYILFEFLGGANDEGLQHGFMLIPNEYFGNAPTAGVEWHTPFTSSFMHAGLMHLVGNLFFFYIFADNLENTSTAPRFISFCLVAAFVSALGQGVVDMQSDIPSLGFSGVVMAVMGAYLVNYPKAKIACVPPMFLWAFAGSEGFTIRIYAWFLLPAYFFLDITGYIDSNITNSGVAYMAHISGFMFGLIFGRLLRVYDTHYDTFMFDKRGQPKIIRSRADEILAKYAHFDKHKDPRTKHLDKDLEPQKEDEDNYNF